MTRVLVVGAGIGGMMCSLALQRLGIAVTVLERDGPPPGGISPADSLAWTRPGVPQALHPHFFMGRLRVLLEERYPHLVERLLCAGVGENRLTDYLAPAAADGYRPRPGDERLRSLNARRTTFEMILREFVTGRPGVRLHQGVQATGLVTERQQDVVRVVGVEAQGAAGVEHHLADAVVDCSGRFSRLPDALAALGVPMEVDQRDSGIWYFTRHYRLRPGQSYPQASGLPGAVYPDFILGALPADNGALTVTFQIYRDDRAVARALRDADHFQAMCMAVDAIRPWVDPARTEPTSKVYGFGQMDSFWRRTVLDGRAGVLGYFAVGDSCVRSNPKFGRGCTWTTVAAHHVADLLGTDCTAGERIARYEAVLEAEFRKDWETMRRLDRSTEAAFEIATGRRRARLGERVQMALQQWVDVGSVIEPDVFREIWSGYHGFQGMSDWARKPEVWLKLLRGRCRLRRYRALMQARARRPETLAPPLPP